MLTVGFEKKKKTLGRGKIMENLQFLDIPSFDDPIRIRTVADPARLGCVVVRYRHLRQAVWGSEPVTAPPTCWKCHRRSWA